MADALEAAATPAEVLSAMRENRLFREETAAVRTVSREVPAEK